MSASASQTPAEGVSLADDWGAPATIEQIGLRPTTAMSAIQRRPTGWIVVEQYVHHGHDSDGISTLLISPEARSVAFAEQSWTGRSLGEFAVVDECRAELGLEQPLGPGIAEFFCQVRDNHQVRPPVVEIAYPFLWYWDAIRDGNDWFYLDAAGREHELVRTHTDDHGHTVEVRALEFRRYLHQREMLGLIQHDYVRWADVPEFDKIDLEYSATWCSFEFHARFGPLIAELPAHSRLLGRTLVTGVTEYAQPAWLDSGRNEYREFVIGMDPESGRSVSYTSDPQQLADYFGKNPEAPHYLTRVHFDPRVLSRYLDEPERYSVSTTRVSALRSWSISIGRTSVGDVEAYLGDLGRDLPWQEHDHWRAHNIAPRGEMHPDRFRRDFLGQFAGETEPLTRLRESLARLEDVCLRKLGGRLFRPLPPDEAVEFERLHPPVYTRRRALVQPILLLTKALVDSLDTKLMQSVLQSKETRSVALLSELVIHLGGDPQVITPVRDLYRVRSSGGIAHLAGNSRSTVLAAAGLDHLSPAEAVESIAGRLADMLDSLYDLLLENETVQDSSPGAT